MPVHLPPGWQNLNTLCISSFASQRSFYGRPKSTKATNSVGSRRKLVGFMADYNAKGSRNQIDTSEAFEMMNEMCVGGVKELHL